MKTMQTKLSILLSFKSCAVPRAWLSALMLLSLGTASSQAASETWDTGGNGGNTIDWANPNNWDGLNAPPSSGDSLTFGADNPAGTANSDTLTNSLTNSGYTLSGITFSGGAPAYTMTGNSFAFTTGTIVANNSSNVQTFSNTGGVILTSSTGGVPTYTITGNSVTFATGLVTQSTSSSAPNSELIYNGTGTLTVDGWNLEGTSGLGLATAEISGNGDIALSGITENSPTQLSVQSTYTGSLVISGTNSTSNHSFFNQSGSAGSVELTGTLNLGTGGFSQSGQSAGLTPGAFTETSTGSITAGSFAVSATGSGGGGSVTLNGSNTLSGSGIISAGTISLGGTITLSAGTESITNATGTSSFSETSTGVIAGAGAWTYNNANTNILAGANTYTGTTTVSSGTLQLSNSQAVADSVLNLNGGTVTFDSAVSSHAFSTAGLSGSGNLALSDTASTPNNVNLTIGDATANTYTHTGILSGGGGLTKVGTNTQILEGDNTFSGPIYIDAGALEDFPSASGFNSFGTGTIYLGDTSGSANATLITHTGTTMSNPLNVRAGSSGTLAWNDVAGAPNFSRRHYPGQ